MSSEYIIDDTVQGGATGEELYAMINERRSLIGDVPEYYDLITSNIITDVLIPYDTKSLRNTALSSYLPLTGGTITNTVNITGGTLNFGTRTSDYLIKLFGDTYGIGINASTVRYNSEIHHKFYAGSTNTLSIDGSGNLSTAGEIYVGSATGSSRIFLGGGCAGDGAYDHSVIETRLYSGSENSEMLLFKGNDIAGPSGPDRIRLRAGAIAFDTYSGATNNRTSENIRMYIKENGNIGIDTTDPQYKLDVNGTANATTLQQGGVAVFTSIANLYLNSNQLSSQKFINSNSIDLNYIKKYPNNSINVNTIYSSGEIRSSSSLSVVNGSAWDHLKIWHDGAAAYFDAGGSENGIIFRIDNTSVGYPASSYPQKMRLYANGNLEITGQFITYSSGNGYMTLNQGNSTVTGYLEFKNASGTRMGYIGNVASGGYIQLQSESTCVGYSMNGNLTVAGTANITGVLTANSIVSSGLVNTYFTSNQLSSQNFINSNSIDLNYIKKYVNNSIDVNTIAITGGNATYDLGNVDATNKTNTYISFKAAGSGSDWCYIRQIGGNEAYKLALDFCDDGTDARFCIRNNKSTDNPDTITEVFTVDNGNVTATGTINGATLQQNGVGVSTLITNALSGYDTIALRNTALSSYLPLTGGNVSDTITVNATNCGKVTLNSGGSTAGICGYVGFFNNAGSRRGYIGWVGANTNYLSLETENGTLGYEVSGHLIVDGTLYANTINSTGLTTLLNAKESILSFSSPLTRVGNTISLDANLSGLTSNQLASQQFINSNSIDLNYIKKTAGGFIGIGTTPNYTLDAYGTNNFIGRCKIDGGGHDANKVDVFGIGRGDGSTKEFTGIKCNVTLGSTVGETYSNHTHINFFTWGNSIAGSREVARITSRGRLGIGSTLPVYEIDTAGSIRATSQVHAYAGSGNGYINMTNGGTGACGYLGIYNPSGTRCCYVGAMANANTYMPIVAESPCIGFDISGKLKIYGNLINDYLFNNNGNNHGNLTDFNNATSLGYNFIQGTTNGPSVNSSTQYYSWNMGLGINYAFTSYGCQFAIGRNVATPYLCVRYNENNSWGGWNKISAGLADNLTGTPNITVGTISAGATTLSSTLSVAGTTTCSSTLTTAGEIQTTGTNVINFGYNVSKTDSATGRIGYGTYEANALCIVGGSTSGSRKVTIWDYVQINGLLTISGSFTMPNGSWFYGGNNVCKRNGVYLYGVYGGGYYYNTIDYSTYVTSEAGTEFCFRITSLNVDTNIPDACLQCYHVWIRNNNGARTSWATVLGQTTGCGIQIGTNNTNLALTYPNNTAGSGLKHIIFENISWASS